MPELPEVETVRRGLAPVMEGQTIVGVDLRRKDLRRPFPDNFAERLKGRIIRKVDRRAKYLVVGLDDDNSLLMHLGMSGSFRISSGSETDAPGAFLHKRGAPGKHDHVVLWLDAGTFVTYNDPRRFGSMDLIATGSLDRDGPLVGLGIEPLGPDFTPSRLAALLSGRQTSIKAALLDQRLIAGLGNIYVCEALWRSGISPLRSAGSVAGSTSRPFAALRRLAVAIPDVLMAAIEAGGSSLRNHSQTDGRPGYFQHSFDVYGREGLPCRKPRCRGTIARATQNGRSTFFCPVCQHSFQRVD